MNTPQLVIPQASEPRVLVTLVTGLLMAFAFQLLLTNLGVAAGMTSLGALPKAKDQESSSLGKTMRTLGVATGLGILLSVNTVLLGACFLAVKLSLVNSPGLGAILGIVIWSAYWLIVTWVSSRAAASLLGSVVSSATSGVQGLLSTVGGAFSSDPNTQPSQESPQAIALMAPESQTKAATEDVGETLSNYLNNLQPPALDLPAIQSELEKLLQSTALPPWVAKDLPELVRQTFEDFLRDRTKFSQANSEQILDQLEAIWQGLAPKPPEGLTAELVDFLQTAKPETLTSEQLSGQLEQLIQEGTESSSLPQRVLDSLPAIDFSLLLRSVLDRIDLSDGQIEAIWHQLQSFKDRITPGATTRQPFRTIAADIEDYLLRVLPQHLESETLQSTVEALLYDPKAAPEQIRQQLETFSQDDFVEILQRRQELATTQVKSIAEQLEAVRRQVLARVQTAEAQAQFQDLYQGLKKTLQDISLEDLIPEVVQERFKTFLADWQREFGPLDALLDQFDRQTLGQLFPQDLKPEALESLIDQLEASFGKGQRPAFGEGTSADAAPAEFQAALADLGPQLESYLRYTNLKNLHPEGVNQKLQTLVDDLPIGPEALRGPLPELDQEKLKQILARRQGLGPKQQQQLMTAIQESWQHLFQVAEPSNPLASGQVNPLTSTIENYLTNLNASDLNLSALKQDLMNHLQAAETGTWALRQRLLRVDWEALGQKLRQRQDLSREQAEQIIAQVKAGVDELSKIPRRWALRVQEAEPKWEAALKELLAKIREYLNALKLPSLDSEAIQQDLQKLLRIPEAGFENLSAAVEDLDLDRWRQALGDQLGHNALAGLIQSRKDLPEWVATQLQEQVEAVRDQLLAQVHSLQQKAQSQVEELKRQGQEQAEAARKATAIAAWWLFLIALSTAVTSAIAGSLAGYK